MIIPPNSDARLNAKLIIEVGCIEVLIHNEELLKQIANIILKLTSQYENLLVQELAQKFFAVKVHEAVIEVLLSKFYPLN